MLLTSAGCNSAYAGPGRCAAWTPAPVVTRLRRPARSRRRRRDRKSFITTGPLVAEQQADIAAERDWPGGEYRGADWRPGEGRPASGPLDDRVSAFAVRSAKGAHCFSPGPVTEWEAEEESAKAGLRRADVMHNEKIVSEEDWELRSISLTRPSPQSPATTARRPPPKPTRMWPTCNWSNRALWRPLTASWAADRCAPRRK